MENVRDIQIEVGYAKKNLINKEKSKYKSKLKSKLKIKKNNILKQKLIIINFSISIILFVLIQVGYTDMVNISSDNLIMKLNNDKLQVEVNTLDELITPLNSDQRIAKIAKARLNMVIPSLDNIAQLEDSKEGKIIDLADFSNNDSSKKKSSVLSAINNIFR